MGQQTGDGGPWTANRRPRTGKKRTGRQETRERSQRTGDKGFETATRDNMYSRCEVQGGHEQLGLRTGYKEGIESYYYVIVLLPHRLELSSQTPLRVPGLTLTLNPGESESHTHFVHLWVDCWRSKCDFNSKFRLNQNERPLGSLLDWFPGFTKTHHEDFLNILDQREWLADFSLQTRIPVHCNVFLSWLTLHNQPHSFRLTQSIKYYIYLQLIWTRVIFISCVVSRWGEVCAVTYTERYLFKNHSSS